MKKLVAIVLVLLILLNTVGYYMVLVGLQHTNDVAMDQRLDADDYEASQTMTIKLPITVPYMSDNGDFERVNGKFQHNGEVYRLVKQRYANDTLTILCVKDRESKKIQDVLSHYVKSFTDKPVSQNPSKLAIFFTKEYVQDIFTLKNLSPGWQTDVAPCVTCFDLLPSFSSSITHPPEGA